MPANELKDIPILNQGHVFMKNKEEVLRKIEKIQMDGADKLQVVTDFDLTLTKQHVNGKRVLSSYGIFFQSKQLSDKTRLAERELFNKYRPIEIDHSLELEKKILAMVEWMEGTKNMLLNIDFNSSEIDDLAKTYGTDLRDGTKELIEKLDRVNVPVLVFSAGLGDVVTAVLKSHNSLRNNVKVISNFLDFNDNKVRGFKNEKLIHVFNKNEQMIDDNYFKILKQRNNIILMGDSTGDAHMAEGAAVDTILKIGFLYENSEKLLPSYLNTFDIVLLDDQTMDVVSDILRDLN